MDRLGVGTELSAYETCPWSVFDDEKGMSCSAEVRMGPDADELEAELQMMYDTPPDGKPPLEQVFIALFRPATGSETKWDSIDIKIKGEGNKDGKYGWEDKALNFFNACVQELKMGKIPDIEEILEREMKDKEKFGDRFGDGSNKSPKIKPQALMGMNKGR